MKAPPPEGGAFLWSQCSVLYLAVAAEQQGLRLSRHMDAVAGWSG